MIDLFAVTHSFYFHDFRLNYLIPNNQALNSLDYKQSHASQALLRGTMGHALDAPQHPCGLSFTKWHDPHFRVPQRSYINYSQA